LGGAALLALRFPAVLDEGFTVCWKLCGSAKPLPQRLKAADENGRVIAAL